MVSAVAPGGHVAEAAGGRPQVDARGEPADGGTLVRESWDISQEKGPVKSVLRMGRTKDHSRKAMEQTLVNIARLTEQ